MAGLFTLNQLTAFSEPEEPPEYNVPMSGMTPDALFSRYIDLSDGAVEIHFENGECQLLTEVEALMHSVACVAFLPIPVLPFFPWKAPVR